MSQRRRLTIFALTLMPLFLLAAPARAQSLPSSTDPFVVVTGRIDIALGDHAGRSEDRGNRGQVAEGPDCV